MQKGSSLFDAPLGERKENLIMIKLPKKGVEDVDNQQEEHQRDGVALIEAADPLINILRASPTNPVSVKKKPLFRGSLGKKPSPTDPVNME